MLSHPLRRGAPTSSAVLQGMWAPRVPPVPFLMITLAQHNHVALPAIAPRLAPRVCAVMYMHASRPVPLTSVAPLTAHGKHPVYVKPLWAPMPLRKIKAQQFARSSGLTLQQLVSIIVQLVIICDTFSGCVGSAHTKIISAQQGGRSPHRYLPPSWRHWSPPRCKTLDSQNST